MAGADRELARRGFLERMTALAAGAVLAPPSLRALSGGPAPSGARVRPWSPPPPGPVQATELVDLTLVE